MNESNMWWDEQDQDDQWVRQQEEELRRHEEESESALFADGFEAALIGIGYQFNQRVAIYDYAKCVYLLERQGMTRDEAVEFMEFNVTGAYVGRATPVFLTQRVDKPKPKKRTTGPRQMRLNLETPE
jgi:hypothetical protein